MARRDGAVRQRKRAEQRCSSLHARARARRPRRHARGRGWRARATGAKWHFARLARRARVALASQCSLQEEARPRERSGRGGRGQAAWMKARTAELRAQALLVEQLDLIVHVVHGERKSGRSPVPWQRPVLAWPVAVGRARESARRPAGETNQRSAGFRVRFSPLPPVTWSHVARMQYMMAPARDDWLLAANRSQPQPQPRRESARARA